MIEDIVLHNVSTYTPKDLLFERYCVINHDVAIETGPISDADAIAENV